MVSRYTVTFGPGFGNLSFPTFVSPGTIGVMFLPHIDAPDVAVTTKRGLDIRAISFLGAVATHVDPQRIQQALDFLGNIISDFGAGFAVHLDVTSLPSTEPVVSLLDAGAAAAFVSIGQLRQLGDVNTVGPERLVLKVPWAERGAVKEPIRAFGDGHVRLLVEDVPDLELLQGWLAERGTSASSVYVLLRGKEHLDGESVSELVRRFAVIPVISASALTVDEKAHPELLPLRSVLALSSDRPDGLYPTIVTDEHGIALGLVYSSAESLQESLRTGRGVYHSRKRGLWYKGESSGDTQELVRIHVDCDHDCLRFTVRQKGKGFCHLGTATCFGPYRGLPGLEKVLQSRKISAPEGSYTARLFSSPQLLRAKIKEEAEELCDAKGPEEVAFEAADLIYFALTKCVEAGVSLEAVERNLDAKHLKTKRRKGDAKGPWAQAEGLKDGVSKDGNGAAAPEKAATVSDSPGIKSDRIQMRRFDVSKDSQENIRQALQRPSQRSTDAVMDIVKPIISAVRERGDAALLEYTHKFDKATSLASPVLRAPFPVSLRQISKETEEAIVTSFNNIYKFHAAQVKNEPLEVETMPGVRCSLFHRPIERVGLYVPGGTAVLPSTALMLGVPALVAQCRTIVLATPPLPDGSVAPEIVYIAHMVGAESIVLAGGAQAVAALAYGTPSVSKVDKILGPGNQFVTAAKMLVANDTSAGVAIDMPAGPSEVLVVADADANPAFVASDLLSQAEHGVDSQVVLLAVDLTDAQLAAIEDEVHAQASVLPRVDIVKGAIAHSVTVKVHDIAQAMELSNAYAPEHLILQVRDAEGALAMVQNAGSVFVGPWTPESVGDYAAGVNHSLPTYGYAKQYSGVSLSSFLKHVTSSRLSAEGLRNVGMAVMQMASVEGLDAHRRAVSIRLEAMNAP